MLLLSHVVELSLQDAKAPDSELREACQEYRKSRSRKRQKLGQEKQGWLGHDGGRNTTATYVLSTTTNKFNICAKRIWEKIQRKYSQPRLYRLVALPACCLWINSHLFLSLPLDICSWFCNSIAKHRNNDTKHLSATPINQSESMETKNSHLLPVEFTHKSLGYY